MFEYSKQVLHKIINWLHVQNISLDKNMLVWPVRNGWRVSMLTLGAPPRGHKEVLHVHCFSPFPCSGDQLHILGSWLPVSVLVCVSWCLIYVWARSQGCTAADAGTNAVFVLWDIFCGDFSLLQSRCACDSSTCGCAVAAADHSGTSARHVHTRQMSRRALF